MLTQPASFLAPASVKPLGARIAPQSALRRCQQLVVRAAQEGGGGEGNSKLPFLLDVNTRGGLLFVSTIGTGGVFGLYKLVVATGVDGLQAGATRMLDGVCMCVRLNGWLAGRSLCSFCSFAHPSIDPRAGIYVSVAMTLAMVGWTLSYIFRVANKDMTYVKQLKNYEDAVLAKRLEELEAEEVEALLEEVEKEGAPKAP